MKNFNKKKHAKEKVKKNNCLKNPFKNKEKTKVRIFVFQKKTLRN